MRAADGNENLAGLVVSVAEMRAMEAAAVAAGIPEAVLMEEAGAGAAAVVRQFRQGAGVALVYAGKGHNAGDAFVMAGHLLDDGWLVEVRMVFPEESMRPLAVEKLAALRGRVVRGELGDDPPRGLTLIADGVLGTGSAGALSGAVREVCDEMNRFREGTGAMVAALEVPTGLDAETGDAAAGAVRADLTIAFGFPKTGHCVDGAEEWCGRLAVVSLSGLEALSDAGMRPRVLTPEWLRTWLPGPRNFGMHKGAAGRVGVVAGSVGFTGAGQLTAVAAGQAGAGLVTLFTEGRAWAVMAAACPPEIMVRPIYSCREVMGMKFDAIAVGPGLGRTPPPDLLTLLRDDPRPMVVDADALNAMVALPSGVPVWPAAGPRLLTPHPGEMERLLKRFAPELSGKSRRDQAVGLAKVTGAVVLLKGSRTCVATADGRVTFNGSGHAAMARGGMGDVLTGLVAAFMAGGMEPFRAACLGSWLIGAGAETWLRRHSGAEASLTASLVREYACRFALPGLRSGGY
jgi:NAD(P)H-hydrate epimerase